MSFTMHSPTSSVTRRATHERKVSIERGKTYQNRTIVLGGLNGGESLIDEGSRDVSDGVNVKIVEGTRAI